MTKMTGESKDIVAERLEQLKALVPEAFAADGRVDFDALKESQAAFSGWSAASRQDLAAEKVWQDSVSQCCLRES